MDARQAREMMEKVCGVAIAKRDELCKLDSHVGDGDHGLTVEKGFEAVLSQLDAEFETPSAVFSVVGKTLKVSMGGAIGPIMGSFFETGTAKLSDKSEWQAADVCQWLTDGMKRVMLIGDVKEGDRTLLDAAAPGIRAYGDALEAGKTMAECMEAAAAGAAKGAENTATMMAKKGRAKFLREKSIGYVDAGATTVSIIFAAMSEYMKTI